MNDADPSRTIRSLSDAVTTFASGRADAQVRSLVTRFEASAKNVASIAATVRDDPSIAPFAPLVERAATALDGGAKYFASRDARDVLVDAETYARTNPLVATAAAVIVGFATARALKASAGNRFPLR